MYQSLSNTDNRDDESNDLPIVTIQMMDTMTEMDMICQVVYFGGGARVKLVPLEKLRLS